MKSLRKAGLVLIAAGGLLYSAKASADTGLISDTESTKGNIDQKIESLEGRLNETGQVSKRVVPGDTANIDTAATFREGDSQNFIPETAQAKPFVTAPASFEVGPETFVSINIANLGLILDIRPEPVVIVETPSAKAKADEDSKPIVVPAVSVVQVQAAAPFVDSNPTDSKQIVVPVVSVVEVKVEKLNDTQWHKRYGTWKAAVDSFATDVYKRQEAFLTSDVLGEYRTEIDFTETAYAQFIKLTKSSEGSVKRNMGKARDNHKAMYKLLTSTLKPSAGIESERSKTPGLFYKLEEFDNALRHQNKRATIADAVRKAMEYSSKVANDTVAYNLRQEFRVLMENKPADFVNRSTKGLNDMSEAYRIMKGDVEIDPKKR